MHTQVLVTVGSGEHPLLDITKYALQLDMLVVISTDLHMLMTLEAEEPSFAVLQHRVLSVLLLRHGAYLL